MAYADLGAVCSVGARRSRRSRPTTRPFRPQRGRAAADAGARRPRRGPPADRCHGTRRGWPSRSWSSSNTSFWCATNAVLELMEMESSVGNQVAFERRRARGRGRRGIACRRACWPISTSRREWARPLRTVRARARPADRGTEARRDPPLQRVVLPIRGDDRQPVRDCEAPRARALLLGREPRNASVVQEVAVGLREYALQAT